MAKAPRRLSKLVAAILAVSTIGVSMPGAFAAPDLTRVNFENQVRLNSKFYKTVYFSQAQGATFSGTNYNANVNVTQTLGQATALTIPDPGAASANFVLDTGPAAAVTIQHVAVPLTSANLKAMYGAPVQLIAAGAAGTNIVVHHVMFTMTSTATTYTGGGVVEFQIGNTVHGAGTATTATVAAAVINDAVAETTYTTVIPVSYTGTAATGLYISNQTAAFATGTGTAIVDIWYSLK